MLYTGKEQPATKNDTPSINNNLPIVTVSTFGKVMAIIFIYIFTLGIYPVVKSNYFRKMQIKINEAASNIDIQLEKRFNTLTKLVDSVKSHVKFDKDVFTTIAAYRSGMDINQKSQMLGKINSALTMAFENYPNLGADESIRTLNTEIVMIEREIAAARRLYNSLVTQFNSEIYQWPNNAILSGKNYQGVLLFVTDESKRQDVNTNFMA